MKPSSLYDRPEITAAVSWWADQLLRETMPDAGDTTLLTKATVSWGRSKLDVVTKKRIERFKMAYSALLACCCANSWKDEEPHWGSGVRCQAVDYGPGPELRCALDYAGISGGELRLPIKTVMWINPGEVKVRTGYHGREVTIYPIALDVDTESEVPDGKT